MFAALSEGPSRIRGLLQSADVNSTAGVLRSLGVNVPRLSDDVSFSGVGLRGMKSPDGDLDCGNSGTTTRLMTGIVAGQTVKARFTGDRSMSARPMKRLSEPLSKMGASFEFERGDGLPMTVTGSQLQPIDWDTGGASAQVKSAIFLAALVSGVKVSVHETARSRDHTERMLRSLGAKVESKGTTVTFEPVREISPLDITVPGDPSSAAFIVALATLADEGEVVIPNMLSNPLRTGFFSALLRMGGSLQIDETTTEAGEDVARVRIRPASPGSISIGAADIPSMIDELPMLACLAVAGDDCELTVSGAAELRVKESDRISAIVDNIRAIGGEADERPDGFAVRGMRRPLRGRVTTRGDHRIAMSFGVLSQLPGNGITIDDPGCVAVSYPDFWKDIQRITS